MSTANWWDVRDMALTSVQIADRTLASVINDLIKQGINLPVFSASPIFATISDFSKIYQINSYDAFSKIIPILNDCLELYIRARIKDCTIDDIKADEKAYELLKKALGHYAIYTAVGDGKLSFTSQQVVVMWEQLPWQKSTLLNDKQLNSLMKSSLEKANNYFNLLIEYIKSNKNIFPCYKNATKETREPIVKRSGLYL